MKVIVADDHELIRNGIRNIIKQISNSPVLLEAEDWNQTIALANVHRDCSLVLLDLNMPGKEGLTGLKHLRNSLRSTPIIVISASENLQVIQAVINGGAQGYITKSLSNEKMKNNIQSVLSGGTCLPDIFTWKNEQIDNTEPEITLTARQQEVLSMLAKGYPNKEIAGMLKVKEATIRAHATSIFKALAVSNRTQAVIQAVKIGLINNN